MTKFGQLNSRQIGSDCEEHAFFFCLKTHFRFERVAALVYISRAVYVPMFRDQAICSSIEQCSFRLQPTGSILHRTFTVTDRTFTNINKVIRNYKNLVKLQEIIRNTCEGDDNSSCEALQLHRSSQDGKHQDE